MSSLVNRKRWKLDVDMLKIWSRQSHGISKSLIRDPLEGHKNESSNVDPMARSLDKCDACQP